MVSHGRFQEFFPLLATDLGAIYTCDSAYESPYDSKPPYDFKSPHDSSYDSPQNEISNLVFEQHIF
jgi:hypothetical protein